MADERLFLRTLLNTDAESMLEWMHDPETESGFVRDFSTMTIVDCKRFIENSWDYSGDNFHLAISSSENNSYMGTVSLKNIDHITHSAEFAIVIHPMHTHRGVGRFALKKMIDIGFKLLNLKTIYLNVICDNYSAINLYRDSGFVRVDESSLTYRGINISKPLANTELYWFLIEKDGL